MSTTSAVSPLWKLRDLRFNRNIGRLYLLQDMDYPVTASLTSTLLEFELPYITGCVADRLHNSKLFSLDSYKGLGVHAIGQSNILPTLFFKKHFNTTPLCFIKTKLPIYYNTESVTISTVYTSEDWPEYNYSVYDQPATTEEKATTTDCEQQQHHHQQKQSR